jgi:subtilisin family serine protease
MQMKLRERKYIVLPLIVLLYTLLDLPGVSAQPLLKAGWHLGDRQIDQVMGISAERAYSILLPERTGIPVVVALIDSGVDTAHRDLSSVLWRNPGEIPGNGKDDDHNGYVDDVHGWNFMGSENGSFQNDNYDLIRQFRQSKPGSKEARDLQRTINDRRLNVQHEQEEAKQTLEALAEIVAGIGKLNPTIADFRNYRYRDHLQQMQLLKIVAALKQMPDLVAYQAYLQSRFDLANTQLNYALNSSYNPRKGETFNDPFSGNGDIQGAWTIHGTHVAGIIAGRTVGVAKESVRLMVLRTIPAGDYLDADMARAIRYAADNGAKVINISAGKIGAMRPELIEAAIKYAMDKDVLIVHAAGNHGQQLKEGYYPRRIDREGNKAKAWLEVGASGPVIDSTLVLQASNYGKAVVDLLAPGFKIHSCSPGNGYAEESGTSMAAPVVSGIAAVLRSQYPKLTAEKICEIIMGSVCKVDFLVRAPNGEMVPLTEICAAGGIANLYKAMKNIEKLKEQ